MSPLDEVEHTALPPLVYVGGLTEWEIYYVKATMGC
jgi:hypothetical protein